MLGDKWNFSGIRGKHNMDAGWVEQVYRSCVVRRACIMNLKNGILDELFWHFNGIGFKNIPGPSHIVTKMELPLYISVGRGKKKENKNGIVMEFLFLSCF